MNEDEDPTAPGFVTFENLGVILNKIGVFQNLEFMKANSRSNQTSLSISQTKMKHERLAREVNNY